MKAKMIKTINNNLLYAILLNVLCFVFVNLFFDPFISADDYFQMNVIYGGYSGEFDYHLPYSSWGYGRLLYVLLNVFPKVPWYPVLFDIICFISLTLLTKYLLDNIKSKKVCFSFSFPILLYAAYELYICMQFTKVSGFIGMIGMIMIVMNRQLGGKIVGFLLVILSISIRAQNYLPILATVVVVFIVCAVIDWRKFFDDLKKVSIKRIVVGLLLIVITFVCYKNMFSFFYSLETDEVREEWNSYYSWTTARSIIWDYMPGDNTEAEICEYLGISENDLFIWQQKNYDKTVVDDVLIEKIKTWKSDVYDIHESIFDLKKIDKFIHIMFKQLLSIDMFFLFWIVVFGLIICAKSILKVIESAFCCILVFLAEEYYLYLTGRYLIHRVDVGLIFGVLLILLSTQIWSDNIIEPQKMNFYFLIVWGMIVLTPYKKWGDDISNDNENSVIYQNYLKEVSEDIEHYYFPVSSRIAYRNGVPYSMYEVPQKGLFYNMTVDILPAMHEQFVKYQLENVYVDAIDNQCCYFVFDENDTNKEQMEKYIEEHSGKNIVFKFVKSIYNRNIYSVVSE